MRVMILSVTAGFGHHATAKAVADMLREKGAVVDTVDVCLLYTSPSPRDS